MGRSGDLSRLRNCWPGDLVEIVQWGAPEAGAFFAVCDDEPWDTNGYLRHHNGGFVVQLGEVCLIIERAQSGWGYKAAAPEGRVGWIRREQCHKLKKRKVKE